MALLRVATDKKEGIANRMLGGWRAHTILALTDLFCVTVYWGIDIDFTHGLF